MQVGFFTMPLHPPGSDITQTLEDDLHQLEVLDSLGYSEAWIGEHFTTVWENNSRAGYVYCQRPRENSEHQAGHRRNLYAESQPVHDRTSHRAAGPHGQGRFQWGVGSGGFPGDFEVFGFDPSAGDHRRMTRDAIETVLSIWDDPQPGSYDSEFWKFTIPRAR